MFTDGEHQRVPQLLRGLRNNQDRTLPDSRPVRGQEHGPGPQLYPAARHGGE